MKTTIDIPDPAYKRAKIRAVERGQTLREIILTSLTRELETAGDAAAPQAAFWSKRKVLPQFARFQSTGAFRPRSGDRDITELISEERDGR